MKRLSLIAAAAGLASGCPSDDSSDDGATTLGTSMDDGATGPGMTDGSGTDSGGSSGGTSGPPVIDGVSWTHAAGCMMNVGSDVTVSVMVTDPDNDESELTFSGTVVGCTGSIDAAEVTLLCPQAGTYSGSVDVEDPDGGSDSLDIMIMPCVDGSAP